MNDKFYYETALTSAKELCLVLFHAVMEASTPHAREVFQNALYNALDWQDTIYKTMESNEWYPYQTANSEIVEQTACKVTGNC